MHEMPTIVISDPVAWYKSVTCLFSAKVAEHIEILFEVETLADPRNIILDGGPDPLLEGEG